MKTLIIFGASGDLTTRKLIPALFQLYRLKKLPEPFNIVGISRSRFTDSQWRNHLKKEILSIQKDQLPHKIFADEWKSFAEHLYYFIGDVHSASDFDRLNRFVTELETFSQNEENSKILSERIYYLALASDLYETVIENLGKTKMGEDDPLRQRRLIIEKPFGSDEKSAHRLNETLYRVFREDQIFRIDHYLGKETVNNIFILRFANTVFEPLWNRYFIDQIQITANESATIGTRGEFYEKTQILRDMFQNHLLQLLTITAMDPPAQLSASAIRDAKVRVLKSIRHVRAESVGQVIGETLFLGQYQGYRQEKGVAPDSQTPTFAAMKLWIDNERWQGVPIYLRSGKGMSCPTTQVILQFKEPSSLFLKEIPREFFQEAQKNLDKVPIPTNPLFPDDANRLLLQIQPSEGIRLSFLTKAPGTENQIRRSELTFQFFDPSKKISSLPAAYERLLLDALSGDPSLFARHDEITEAWRILDPFLEYWEKNQDNFREKTASHSGYYYPIGSWGPLGVNAWIEQDGRYWFDYCPIL